MPKRVAARGKTSAVIMPCLAEERPAREEKHEVRIAGRPLPTVSWTVSFGAHFRSLRWAGLVSLAGRERRKIPDFQRVVTAAAHDPLPVGAETHAGDIT